jgi:hypothetical protein
MHYLDEKKTGKRVSFQNLIQYVIEKGEIKGIKPQGKPWPPIFDR